MILCYSDLLLLLDHRLLSFVEDRNVDLVVLVRLSLKGPHVGTGRSALHEAGEQKCLSHRH